MFKYPHHHTDIFIFFFTVNAFVSWRWVARVASGSERVTRQTRAGREVIFFIRMCRETETVVKTWFSPCHIYIGHRFCLSAHLTITSRPGELGGGDAGAT